MLAGRVEPTYLPIHGRRLGRNDQGHGFLSRCFHIIDTGHTATANTSRSGRACQIDSAVSCLGYTLGIQPQRRMNEGLIVIHAVAVNDPDPTPTLR